MGIITTKKTFETMPDGGLEALELVRPELALVEQKMKQGSEGEFASLAEVLINLIDSGGKRLRPALVIMAASFHPCEQNTLIAVAASIETLHTATLVHDDVIDEAVLRRGLPTLNTRWSKGATILAGDYLFARAAAFAFETENFRVMRIFSNVLQVIVAGELRQMLNTMNWKQTSEDYHHRIQAKTSALFSAATESGAVLSNASEDEVQALKDYGSYLGTAFQIVDDILDFIGDDEILGKPAGNDLRQGTLTLPVFHYLREFPGAASELQVAVGNQNGIDDVLERIRQSGAIEIAYEEASDFKERAQKVLSILPRTQERQALHDLADFAISRLS